MTEVNTPVPVARPQVQPLVRQQHTARRLGTFSWTPPFAAAQLQERNARGPVHVSFSHLDVGTGSDGSIEGVFRIPANCRAAEDTPAIATPTMNMEAEHIANTIRKIARAT